MPTLDDLMTIAPQVGAARAEGRPVVALESTLITHGLAYPRNLEAARAAEAAVRARGAIPATIGIGGGKIRVGLDEHQLEALATARDPWKVSRQNLAASLGRDAWAGTTVSATMVAADLAGIVVFATGGIGGVHRGAERTMDISADIEELSRISMVVVCAGPKSILDVPRTLEALETRGVPVVGWRSDEVAGFFSRGSGLAAPIRVDDAEQLAALYRRHIDVGLGQAILVTVPAPAEAALPDDEVRAVIEQATAEADAAGIHGPATTPFVLARVAELTQGRSITANMALIEHNAGVAAEIAIALARP